MDIFLVTILILVAVLVMVALWSRKKRSRTPLHPLSPAYRQILETHVDFYNKLAPGDKTLFESRVQLFLSQIKITGVNTQAEDLDKVLIAASAIIPIFGFPDWEYVNLNEVLLYPDSFDDSFRQEGSGRNTLGMVGTGAYHRIMILSQHELRQGFINKTGKSNTAIHEFVHLLDKTDGEVDGIPDVILDNQYIMPWLKLMRENIEEIRERDSDINPYGATNEAEFFAVVSEYFFERPELLEQKHPELFRLLARIFRQAPQAPKAN